MDIENATDTTKNFPTIKYILTAKILPYDGMIIDPSSIDKIRKELSNLPILGDNFSISISVELDSTDLSITVETKDSLGDVKITE